MTVTDTVRAGPQAGNDRLVLAHTSTTIHIGRGTGVTARVLPDDDDGPALAVVDVPAAGSVSLIGDPKVVHAWLTRATEELAEAIAAHVRAGMDEPIPVGTRVRVDTDDQGERWKGPGAVVDGPTGRGTYEVAMDDGALLVLRPDEFEVV